MAYSYNGHTHTYVCVCKYVHIARWVDLKDIILGKRSQTQQSTYVWFQFHKVPELEIEARLVLTSDGGRRILTEKKSEGST